ncbi:hypothetical protein [Limimaricola pyoseonensis]|uniref:Uncharacterized protein n=1 Tax=Limimaricola pyoseonensis TaxID=521013 RepID=A0A1G7GXP7_9RHOB|nr:hypothetical protein [Limimaricola pyoseonensis]SDE92833.1 hypothetical protein SAMN04488567_2971 [Limimaricola pyoseonensis]
MTIQAHIYPAPAAESCEATVTGAADIRVVLHELGDGGLMIDLQMDEDQAQGLGITAVQFDFAAAELLPRLSLSGPELRAQRFGAGSRGHDCTALLAHPHSRRGQPLRRTAMVLAHDSLVLTLDDLAGQDFVVRLAPVAANHAACDGLTVTGRFPTRPAAVPGAGRSTDGSVFGGVMDEIMALTAPAQPARRIA